MKAGVTLLLSKHKPFVSILLKEYVCAEGRLSSKTWGTQVPETNRMLRVQLVLPRDANLPPQPHLSPPSSGEALGCPRSTRSVTHIPLAEKSSPAVSCTKQTGAIEHQATKCSVPTRSQSEKAANQPRLSKSD